MVLPSIERIKQEAGRVPELARSRQQNEYRRESRHRKTAPVAHQRLAGVLTILPEYLKRPDQEHGGHHDGNFCVAQSKCCRRHSQEDDLARRLLLRHRQNPPQDQRSKNKTEANGAVLIDTRGDVERGHHDIEQGDPCRSRSVAPQSANKKPHGDRRGRDEAQCKKFLGAHRP